MLSEEEWDLGSTSNSNRAYSYSLRGLKMITAKLIRSFTLTLFCALAFTTGTAQNLDELAAKGPAIAAQDPLAVELRDQQRDDLSRRGFDIGMAAAEGQTLPGPGKTRIHDALSRPEQGGFNAAVSFSLERNKNLELATTGARIAQSDDRVAAARNVEANVFFKLGFDIASGIFGSRAQGGLGNTLTGPGSLRIRDSLSAAGQRGFDASVKFHLGQTAPEGESASDRGGPTRVIDNRSGVGSVIDRSGPGTVIDRENSRLPNISKPLIITAQGTALIQPVPSGKINLYQTTTAQIFLAISYEDGTPFPLAKSEDIRITLLPSRGIGSTSAEPIDADEGLWGFTLPKTDSSSRLYLISVVVDAKAWRTTFQGRAIVRVDYTRLPYWNAQRVDGTIWEPPK
jgi:hypothetical protein